MGLLILLLPCLTVLGMEKEPEPKKQEGKQILSLTELAGRVAIGSVQGADAGQLFSLLNALCSRDLPGGLNKLKVQIVQEIDTQYANTSQKNTLPESIILLLKARDASGRRWDYRDFMRH